MKQSCKQHRRSPGVQEASDAACNVADPPTMPPGRMPSRQCVCVEPRASQATSQQVKCKAWLFRHLTQQGDQPKAMATWRDLALGGVPGGVADSHRLAIHSAIRQTKMPGAQCKALPVTYAQHPYPRELGVAANVTTAPQK
jgi:hypothetical protein